MLLASGRFGSVRQQLRLVASADIAILQFSVILV